MDPLRILILGAHPDDAEFHAGGLAAAYRQAGHVVKMVSLTNGDAGHHVTHGPTLASRRRQEAGAAGAIIGAEYAVWDHHDGLLQPTLELRFAVIRELRQFRPDLVLTHRPDDYHPDHRAVGNVVRDASYMVTVPAIVPEVPILRRDPVVAYMPDRFTKPYPLQPDVVIDVTPYFETIVDMLACHESQFFEWLPFNHRQEDQVPRQPTARRAWLREQYAALLRSATERYRPQLRQIYGPQRGDQIEFAEAFEISEYAAPLDAAARQRLFPMLSTG